MPDQDTYGSGTNEFLGIILPLESQKEQQNGDEGVGYRYRVAVMGSHPSDETVKDTDIIYAMVALGVSDGTGAGGKKKTPAISQGDVVMGKFMDGDRKQNPVITNVLGRTKGVKYGTGRFDIKTGYVGNNTDGNLLDQSEFSETVPICTPSARVDNSTDKRETKDEDLAKSGLGGGNEVGALKPPEDPKPQRRDFGGGRGGAASYNRALRNWKARQ
tara:strand:- start:22319 stop:22966 length:648 start_codon:yes stop_codon:yes gene_type:complete